MSQAITFYLVNLVLHQITWVRLKYFGPQEPKQLVATAREQECVCMILSQGVGCLKWLLLRFSSNDILNSLG